MAHLGLICLGATGHLNPMTTLGYELKQRGHRVTLFGVPNAEAKTLAAGLEFQVIGQAAFAPAEVATALARLGQLSGKAALQHTLERLKQVAVMLLQEAPAAIKSEQVDLLLIDQAVFAGGTVADVLGLPFVTVCCALMLNYEPGIPPLNQVWSYRQTWWSRLRDRVGHNHVNRVTRPIRDLVAVYRQEQGLPLYTGSDDAYSRWAQLSQQPAAFEFPRQQLPKCFHFTGPYSNPASRIPADFPFDQLTGQPLIYASLGTLQNRLIRIFEVIAAACADLEAQLVIALGGGSKPEALPELPGSPLVVGYAPQLELLQRATLTITHAGLNTTLESLSHGVPMVAIPITNDQPGVAARMAWTGTGEVVSLKGLTVPRLRCAVQQVLTEATYKNNALRLQQAIQQAGGVKRAAEIVEQVLATGQPVLSEISP